MAQQQAQAQQQAAQVAQQQAQAQQQAAQVAQACDRSGQLRVFVVTASKLEEATPKNISMVPAPPSSDGYWMAKSTV